VATLTLFGNFPLNALGGDAGGEAPIDFLTDTIKVSLHTSAATFDQDADHFFSDIGNEVAGGNGYTANGYTLANKAVTYVSGSNKTVWDNTVDPTWTASGAGFAASHAVFYKDTGTGTTSPLIGYLAFGSTITLAASDTLTIQLDATNGIFYATVP
jgi:hypothetical protein